jgi:precorrin-2/cobalt-factor-2 C20-methyltransferase
MSKFYGIGVGPGDEKLLTLKAVEVLKQIDVLLIPQTKSGKKGVAHTIAGKYLKDDLIIEYISFPMVTDERVFEKAGEKASDIICMHIGEGKTVGFITLGDPSVYSTYGYIASAVKDKVDIETIPGITSFCAAAAMDNRPLVQKDEILSIIPMNASDARIDRVLKASDAFMFMKVYKREKRVLDLLLKNKLVEKAILALRCGFSDAKIASDFEKELSNNKEYLSVVHTRK